MTSQISYTSFDAFPHKLVPVIASFDTQGHICPLYVRIDGVRLKIASYWEKNHFRNITEFVCQVESNGTLRPILLSYYHDTQNWVIHK